MKTYIKCYRKAYPEEILKQLEPVLRDAGFMWHDIVAAFQGELEKRGLKIYVEPDDLTDQMAGSEYTYLCISDEKLESDANADK